MRNAREAVMRTPVILVSMVVAVIAIGCSSTGSVCTTNADCASGQRCLFPIGSCSATGQCESGPSGPEGNSEEELCGCNGSIVATGCGFPNGFASGPTTGASGPCPVDAN